jgi:hypothetical protein
VASSCSSRDAPSKPFVLSGTWNFGISTGYPQRKSLILKKNPEVPKPIPEIFKLDI